MTAITDGHKFGIIYYKRRKFGVGALAWQAFRAWQVEIIGRECDIDCIRDDEAKRLIDEMKKLPDVGQGRLMDA